MPNREEIHNCAERLLGSSNGMTAATLTTSMTGANNDIKLTAKVAGVGGNAISLTLVDPSANDQALAITVTASDISVSLATGPAGAITTTATALVTALNADAAVASLVTAAVKSGDTGAGVVTALTKTALTSGAATAVALTSSSLDCDGFDSAHFNLHIGQTLTAGLTYKITESDDNSTFTDAPSTSVVDDAPTAEANKTIRVAYVGNKRYAKLVATPAGATDMTITGHLGYASKKPVSNPI